MREADVLGAVTIGNERRYQIDRTRWAKLLGRVPDELPVHRDWPQLLQALRRLSRWLENRDNDSKSEYMLASDARVLAAEITPDLLYAGLHVERPSHTGAGYWQDFVSLALAAAAALNEPLVSNEMSNEGGWTSRI